MDNKNEHILLVEDNKRDADLTIRSLEQSNIDPVVKWAKDGTEAIKYLFDVEQFGKKTKPVLPKVILLNLKMHKMDGLELLRKVRNHKKTKHIPVVIITSSSEKQNLIKSYELGTNSFIVKQIDFNKYRNAVIRVASYWISLNKTIPVNEL